MFDQNRNNLAGLVHLMKLILGMTLLFEGAGTLLFGVYFYAAGYADSFSQAFRYGLFHSVSSYTNAGFDLFGNSLQNYADDYFVQGLSMVLMVLGAIGFPVLAELREYVGRGRGKFRFSLYTKVTTATYGLLLIAGAAGIWLTENRSFFATLDWQHKLSYALFASVTARSAGLTTFDPAALSDAGKLVLSTLMFIGASPSSMGGGVRTTTIAVIVMMLVTFVRGGSEVRLFGRSLHQEDVIKSFAFFSTALALLLAGVWFICMAEPLGTSFAAILFEASSAFGTCGLSTGITGTLTPASKIALILLMYIGRIGMMLFLSSFRSSKPQPDLRYPAEKLIIG
ncbi:TrkH family potassium uptake protein [Paenibacillus filicis]|uniref:TrkH family potassium uptake protein n=1 Tax=Paenibacillus gyeongsangnamensis TaxID=3388067 RepID=A0ABT4Q7F9_9BACL|nr:potassium transporter TrkG [Paenibacillus filicis]MCZ8512758.1 TrkH family potassium uptake protein [Paenibacillus filicis]